MSKQGLLNILEGVLDILKRLVLFLPAFIGLIDPPKPRVKAKKTKVKEDNASPSS